MKMSDKLNGIYGLVEVDNKEAIVSEIRALKNFTEKELSSIFGYSNILWILENYTVRELKDLAKKVEEGLELHEGDIFTFKDTIYDDRVGIAIKLQGARQDRCIALVHSSSINTTGYFRVLEGISAFDVNVIGNAWKDGFDDVISRLEGKEDNNLVVEGGDI